MCAASTFLTQKNKFSKVSGLVYLVRKTHYVKKTVENRGQLLMSNFSQKKKQKKKDQLLMSDSIGEHVTMWSPVPVCVCVCMCV